MSDKRRLKNIRSKNKSSKFVEYVHDTFLVYQKLMKGGSLICSCMHQITTQVMNTRSGGAQTNEP